ncbi:MAG: response regulator transcription factor [Gammaproteobacteria bacterium]|nr:response regulator transcription factor [Gammaproteobacteria bacterium]
MGIKVILADDHQSLRAGFRGIIEAAPDVEVVSEMGNGRDTVFPVVALRPNVFVMDVTMPGVNGVDATREITELASGPGPGIIRSQRWFFCHGNAQSGYPWISVKG